MDKRDMILKIMEQIGEWADENDITMSTIDEIELAERIYNMLVIELGADTLDAQSPGEWRRGGQPVEYEVEK